MNQTLGLRGINTALRIGTLVILLILCLPTFYLILWSFWGTSTVGLLDRFTLDWYGKILGTAGWWISFGYSILIASSAAILSSLSTVCYFYFSFWEKGKYQSVAFFLLLGPLFVPSVIYALALRTMFQGWGSPEWITLIIGNVALLLPVQYFMLESGNEAIRDEWIHGAATLGASHWEIIRRVLLPNFRAPIIWAFVMGFLIAFDEIVIATFVIYSATTTVPKKMWDAIGTTMDPTPAVLGVLILIFALTVVRGGTMWTKKLSRREWIFSGESENGASFWSYFFKTARLKRELAIAIPIAAIIRLMLLWHLSFGTVASEFLFDIGLVCLTFPYPGLYEVFKYRRFFRTVMLREEKNRRTASMLGKFFLDRAMSSFDEAMDVAFREGVVLTEGELDSFCRLCFKGGRGIYHGTDSNPPSEFMRRYPYYLSYQELNQDGQMHSGIRILLVTTDALAADYKANGHEFELFRDWHISHSIDLFQVEPTLAEQRATSFNLPSTDLGIWNNYVISFIRVSPGEAPKIAIQFADTERFERSRAYFLDLLDRANKIEIDHGGVQCVPVGEADRYKERVKRQWGQ